ncbi:hypothetical protein LguiA_028883 [Lonicera macranthoides]
MLKGSLRAAPTIIHKIASTNLLLRLRLRLQLMTTKAPNRAAVHGTKLPVTVTLQNREKVEAEIEEGKAEKEKKRKEIEEAVDSMLKTPESCLILLLLPDL